MGVAGDQRIPSGHGLLKAKDLYENHEMALVQLTSQKDRVYILKLSRGLTLKATADHLIVTDKGPVKVKNLQAYDKIAHQYQKGAFGDLNIPGEAYFLGKNRMGFDVPTQIWRADEASQWQYIRALYDSTGWAWTTMIEEEQKIRPKIWVHLKIKNRRFLEQTQLLLLNLGITSSIFIKRNQIGLYINSIDQALKLNKYIGILDRYNVKVKPFVNQPKVSVKYCSLYSVEYVGEEPIYQYIDKHKQPWVCNGIICR
jgi:intein/homing endonuclease